MAENSFFSVKVLIKTAEASIECKGLHDLDELDRSKLFFLCGQGRRGEVTTDDCH